MSGFGGAAAPETPALICGPRTLSFGRLGHLHHRLAGRLDERGVGVGDRVALLSPNRIELLAVTTGALRAGIVPVPISPLLSAAERAHLLEDSGASVLFAGVDEPTRSDNVEVVMLDGLESWLEGAVPAHSLAGVTLTRPLHYSSGTTGRPKGVWVPPAPEAEAQERSKSYRRQWGITGADVHLVCSPLTHSGPHRFAVRTLEAGGRVVLQERFEPEATLAAVARHRVTTTFMVPTHLERILALPEATLRRYDLASMRLLAHAGAPIRRATKLRSLELWPENSVWEFLGSTEGGFTRISPHEAETRPGSVGRPEDGAQVEIRDQDTGRVLPAGEAGVVWLRDQGAERFEYWGDPAATATAWDGDAFTVGDLGRLDDDGYLYLLGRPGDLIITGGINVYPQEVEEGLAAHADVAEALVFGVDDAEWGQRVSAAIVPTPGRTPDPEAIRRWLRNQIATYKCPRTITVVAELSRTPTGKIKRGGIPPPLGKSVISTGSDDTPIALL